MKNLYSIWTVPQKNDEQYLRKIIDKLARENNSPSFTPHLTLLPEVRIEFDKLSEIMNDIFTNESVFKVKKTGISQSDHLFQTVFIEFELNEELKKLFNKLSAKTDKRPIETFKPHISLIYKKLTQQERMNIVNKIKVKDEYIIGKVIATTPKEGNKDFLDIPNWRHPYIKILNRL